MKKFLSRFRALPLETRQLLSIGLVLALFVALPLFVWAITTQRFELRKRAQEAPTYICPFDCQMWNPAGQNCAGAPQNGCGFTIEQRQCTAPYTGCVPYGPSAPTPTPQPKPTFTPMPSPPPPCEGKADGTECTICPACTYSVPRCLAPCRVGTCQNSQCVPLGPTPESTCPDGPKGNLNCDGSSLINATDLAILLSKWRNGSCPYPYGIPGGSYTPDLNGDCSVNTTDLSILLANWKPI